MKRMNGSTELNYRHSLQTGLDFKYWVESNVLVLYVSTPFLMRDRASMDWRIV